MAAVRQQPRRYLAAAFSSLSVLNLMRIDLGIVLAVAMLVVWALGALVYDGPGWVHLLLIVGVTLLIWRVVARSTGAPPGRP